MQLTDLEYKTLSSIEAVSRLGHYGIKILISVPYAITERDQDAGYECLKLLKNSITRGLIANDTEELGRAKSQREKLLHCFALPIFIEEIPNGYCPDACCEHIPWFIVTTAIGRIKIGWRKRVINIDWSDTIVKEKGEVIFAGESTTVGDTYIHAWSYEEAEEYISRLMEAGKK